jgi:hypothetical protein
MLAQLLLTLFETVAGIEAPRLLIFGVDRQLESIILGLYRFSYHLTPASNRCLVYATLVRTSFGINFRPFLNML